MQPVRVIIAAIFFVIGLLIVIPAVTGGNGTSDASSTTEPTPTETPPASPTTGPTRTGSVPPTETAEPDRPATPAPSTPAPTRSTPPAAPTSASPARALTVSFGKTDCPVRKVKVKVTNDTGAGQGYAITRDGSLVLADQLGPNASRTSQVTLAEDERVTVRVTQDGEPVDSQTYRLDCRKAAADGPADPEAAERLPNTGSDETVLVARIATGVASLITGAIVLWWGGLWPRRRENVFGRAERG